MKFSVITEPASSYSGLSVTSQTFNVSAREFYLEVITQPDKANQSEIFGVPPVVEVRDLGTRARGHPLKGDWSISASLKPSALNGTLSGVLNVTVEKERAEFNNLSVSFYGIGYKLIFESNQGHMVCSGMLLNFIFVVISNNSRKISSKIFQRFEIATEK